MSTEIDFKTKKTEAEWQQTFDAFWRRATPQWFAWLEWLAILAGVDYAAQKTNSLVLKLVAALSHFALFFYLQSFFFSVRFKGIPLARSDTAQRAVSLVISGLLALAVWLGFRSLLSQL